MKLDPMEVARTAMEVGPKEVLRGSFAGAMALAFAWLGGFAQPPEGVTYLHALGIALALLFVLVVLSAIQRKWHLIEQGEVAKAASAPPPQPE